MAGNGILLIASTERHLRAANECARSARRHMKDVLIDICCDDPQYLDQYLFDEVRIIDNPHRRSKVDYLPGSRFDRTLYVDSDIRFVADIMEIFDLLDRFDIAVCHAHARNRPQTNEFWKVPIPKSFPQYNGGVILYKSESPKVRNFMQSWSDAFHTAGFLKDQVTFRELLWTSDLSIHTLPPEYNVRYEKYLKVWAKEEAQPKILHFARFKDDVFVAGEVGKKYLPTTNSLDYRFRKALNLKPKHRELPKPNTNEKIFGIGFHKTGTSSLTAALRRLGYNTIHGDGRGSWPGADEGRTLIRLIESNKYELPTFSMFDAFVDNPYFTIWKQLDEKFDGKFILTLRDPEKWVESCAKYYRGRRIRPMREWIFGEHADPSASDEARQAWLAAFNRHNEAVMKYFEGRKNLLVIDVTAGDGWEKLCPFLEKPVPDQPFPHANETK